MGAQPGGEDLEDGLASGELSGQVQPLQTSVPGVRRQREGRLFLRALPAGRAVLWQRLLSRLRRCRAQLGQRICSHEIGTISALGVDLRSALENTHNN